MAKHIINKESGLAILPVLIAAIIVAFFVMYFLADMQSSTQSIQVATVQKQETQALAYGGAQATATLNSYPNWPEIMSSPQYFDPTYNGPNNTQTPVLPSLSYWQSCTSAQYPCAKFTYNENGVPITIEYIIYADNSLSVPLSGYQDSGQIHPTQRYYVAFVHASTSNNNIEANKLFILRKVMM